MPKGDPAGYLPNVQAARDSRGSSDVGPGKKFGKKGGKRPFGKGKSAPIQKSLRSGGGRFGK